MCHNSCAIPTDIKHPIFQHFITFFAVYDFSFWCMECYDGSNANAEASSTCPTPCSSLRKGGYVMLKGQPCKIVELLTSTPGKHGHSKVSHLVLHIILMHSFSIPL